MDMQDCKADLILTNADPASRLCSKEMSSSSDRPRRHEVRRHKQNACMLNTLKKKSPAAHIIAAWSLAKTSLVISKCRTMH